MLDAGDRADGQEDGPRLETDPLDGDASSDGSGAFDAGKTKTKSRGEIEIESRSGVEGTPLRLHVVDDDDEEHSEGRRLGTASPSRAHGGDDAQGSVDMSLRLSAVSLPDGIGAMVARNSVNAPGIPGAGPF